MFSTHVAKKVHRKVLLEYLSAPNSPQGSLARALPKKLAGKILPEYSCAPNSPRRNFILIFILQEGHGRQDRKLAVAHHLRKRNGRSEFIIAQNSKGIYCSSDDSFLGTITSNLMGSKYQVWQQGRKLDFMKSQTRLLGVVAFLPTIATLAGSFRSMRVCIPKQKSMQTKTANKTTQIEQINGLPKDWEEKRNIADELFSRVPYYNNITKRYELDFRERAGRTGSRIQTSVKNFQLTMEKNGRQTILQLGRVEKSKYVIDYRYPLTGYQAFCICLASIDSKLCCSV